MVSRDPLYWKWAIIAAHGALSGACVCRLTRTDGSGALDKDSTKELRKSLTERQNDSSESDRELPPLRVASLFELLRRLPNSLEVQVPRKFHPDLSGAARDFWFLNEWRSEFIHFKPESWHIEVDGLPSLVRQAVRKISDIITDPHDCFPRYRPDLIHRLAAAEKLLDGLEAEHSAVSRL